MNIKAAVVTVSDKGSSGERPDVSGDTLERLLKEFGAYSIYREIVPDERRRIADAILKFADDIGANLIITTGGTGLGQRDVTPEATADVIDRSAPGFAEAIRAGSLQITPHAMLSRALSGARGSALILNFPGSPKACTEAFAIVAPALRHAIELLAGESGDCAR